MEGSAISRQQVGSSVVEKNRTVPTQSKNTDSNTWTEENILGMERSGKDDDKAVASIEQGGGGVLWGHITSEGMGLFTN